MPDPSYRAVAFWASAGILVLIGFCAWLTAAVTVLATAPSGLG
jgi:uncharacterized membrane protein YphA (DoxX/SURF4 family)